MGISEEELDAADFDIAQLFPGARRATDGETLKSSSCARGRLSPLHRSNRAVH